MSVVGPSDKFIGTLNIDDFATYSVTLDLSPNLAPGRYSIPVTISFKDGKNQDHSLTKNVDIMVYSNSDFSRLNSGQSPSQGASGFGSRRNTNSNAGGLFGLGLIPTIAIAIIVLIALYFGYKKFGPKKKPVEKVEK